MWRQSGEARRHTVARRGGSSGGTGRGDPTFIMVGKNSGGILWERVVPVPGQTAQASVPAPR